MKKLCLLAISYNENEHIKFWIDNHKDFVDEIILVDTGSTDKTVEIAKENGIRVFYFKWKHDFSKAKNFALQCCREKCNPDWILFMSPDFWVSHDDMRKVRQAIEIDEFDAYRSMVMYHHNGWFDFSNITTHGEEETGVGQIVLYRNDFKIHYTERVHETVEWYVLTMKKRIGYLDIIRHHDDLNIDKTAREIYFTALRGKRHTLQELDVMRENLYKK